jgi:predicted O-methyltransferase YrrM
MDWTAGYVADIGYTYGYYAELNPLHMRLAFLHAGVAMPEVATACELGFGQGISVNLHAAGSGARWYGNDFNPSHAAFAQELAAQTGAGASLSDDSFAEYLARPDLPEFDFIGLHGIWSWVSDANRALIVEFIRKKLKVGGVVYISYNTQPGWAAYAPLRHLMTRHADTMGVEGAGVGKRVTDAFAFAGELLALNPAYLRVNPAMKQLLEADAKKEPSYLAHEYFNRDWHPMHFSTMSEWMTQAKLAFACSASYLDLVDSLHFTQEQQAFMSAVPDPLLRQEVRDFMINQKFRRDYWVKGIRTMTPQQRNAAIRAQRIVLATARENVSLKVNGMLGEAEMAADLYNPLLDLLADHVPRTLGEIETALAGRGVALAGLLQASIVLGAGGHVFSAHDDETIARLAQQTSRYNAGICERSAAGMVIQFLASPVTGASIMVNRFHQIFLMARAQGYAQPAEWARFAWDLLTMQGEKLVINNKTLESDAEGLERMTEQAKVFGSTTLPLLQALRVA